MKAAEIEARIDELRANLRKSLERPNDATIPANVAGSAITQALFTGEIALQLAKLNENLNLDPRRIVDLVVAIQEEIEKREKHARSKA